MGTAHSRSRGKTIALASACVSVALLVLAAWVGYGWVVETWYLRQLHSTDEEARLEAAEKLGEMRSLRAVPRLLELMRKEDRELAVVRPMELCFDAPPPAHEYAVSLTPLLHTLYRAGPKGGALVKSERERLRKLPFAIEFATQYISGNGENHAILRRADALDFILEAWKRNLKATRVLY